MAARLPCHIRVVEARDLKAADVQGSSDPLVVISLKGLLKKKHRTSTIANTVNPVWNEEFILEPHHPEKDSVVIKVYDRDIGKNDLLGMLRLPLFNYFNRGSIDEWRPLVTKTGAPARGDIRLIVNWGTDPIAHALPGSLSMMENRSAYGESAALGYASANPLDKNHDGRVDIRDITHPTAAQQGVVYSQQNSSGAYPLSVTTTTVNQTGMVQANPLDRNHDGRVDMADLTGRGTATTTQQTTTMLPQTGAYQANPLDRNHDGRVDMADLTARNTGAQQSTYGTQTGGYQANPLDRNHDGRVDMADLTARNTGAQQSTYGTQAHANPLDRNHDGKVNLQDLSGRQQVSGQPTTTTRY